MGLVDKKGEMLVNEKALEEVGPKLFTQIETQALLTGILQTLATIHGKEVLQLITIRAQAVEQFLEKEFGDDEPG